MSCNFLLSDLPPFCNSNRHAEVAEFPLPCISQADLGLVLGQFMNIPWSEASVCSTIKGDKESQDGRGWWGPLEIM